MPQDKNGTSLKIGDYVTFETATQELLYDLPIEDQHAIKAQIGNVFEIKGFNEQGNPELEFEDETGVLHTIWVENTCVMKVTY